ncbi:MAG: M28 family peptidase [Blastocatellia bacterium]|nr:M28 family peptidase [Blastocatellia bacterium]
MYTKTRFLNRITLACLILIIAVSCIIASQSDSKTALTADVEAALARISADSLRGHLSFIASDLLEGRDTPSPGLDIAAEYIAAQFRRAGLEPAGDEGFFQTANWGVSERDAKGFDLKFKAAQETISIDKDRVSVSIDKALNLSGTPLFKIATEDAAALDGLKPEQVEGKAVVTEMSDLRRASSAGRRAGNQFLSKINSFKPALILSIDRSGATGSGPGPVRLIDPENRSARGPRANFPLVTVHDSRAAKMYDAMKAGPSDATVSLRLDAPAEKPIKLRNVLGVLRGSDPSLKDTYILVTAHYDHIGKRPGGEGDQIFNGANDDGSGTVSVIELATALATLKERPKRSIVFMTVFGEEKGLLGSRYYGRHPVFPIEKTVANINLEQVGRTDSTEGPQVANATFTGFDYSDVPLIFKAAGEMTGVTVYKHERNSDAFFGRSDNQALADQGVPAHTLCVAYDYPDYHGAGDHWDKIDYSNLERVNRMIALGLVMIANNTEEPKWNEEHPRAARYVKAWKEQRGK